jgi:hypothetical protein
MGMDPRKHGIAINRSSMDIVEARHLIYGSWDMAVWGNFHFFFFCAVFAEECRYH